MEDKRKLLWIGVFIAGFGFGIGFLFLRLRSASSLQNPDEAMSEFAQAEKTRRSRESSDLDVASLIGQEMRYLPAERLFGSLGKGVGFPSKKGQGKTRYIGERALSMLGSQEALGLEDIGVAYGGGSGKNEGLFLGIGISADLKNYRPETEENLAIQTARQSRKARKGSKTSIRNRRYSQGTSGKALGELKAAAVMGAMALGTEDPDAQVVLSRAFLTGENIGPALKKVKREESGSSEAARTGSLLGRFLSRLSQSRTSGGWGSLLSSKETRTTHYESVNPETGCSVCGTVKWEGVLAGPGGTVGQPAPSAGSPYTVQVNQRKLQMSVSVGEIQ